MSEITELLSESLASRRAPAESQYTVRFLLP